MERLAGAARRGADWLWRQQAEDGGFHSATYGFLRGGHSITGLALLALPTDEGTAAGLAFLTDSAVGGGLGLDGVAIDYPVYATSLAILACARHRPAGWAERVTPLAGWLRGQQLTLAAGWEKHKGQGGFPMGRAQPVRPPGPVHVDLSMTRTAVEALVAAGASPGDPALDEARSFALRCRTPASTFVYSAAEPQANKGRDTGDPGYGSATADGVRTLAACGGAAQELTRSVEALRAMHRTEENPRIGPGAKRAFAGAMRGYYRAVAARVFRTHGGPAGWARALGEAIVAAQRPDGSWQNDQSAQKEDDPLIATSLALLALGDVLAPGVLE